MRTRMETEIAKESADGFNIKTGRGGMVDVEFIVQYLQLTHGGEYPALRVGNTLRALQALQATSLLAPGDFTVLDTGYRLSPAPGKQAAPGA